MVYLHLSTNGKPAIIDPSILMYAEECEGKDKDGNQLRFTRLYLKQPLPGDNGTSWIDVQESVEKIAKAMK